MNKSQSAGMYIVLAIVILLFVSSVFLSSPATKVSEISYSNFMERLDKGEFKKIEKADDFLIAIPKVQPETTAKKPATISRLCSSAAAIRTRAPSRARSATSAASAA